MTAVRSVLATHVVAGSPTLLPASTARNGCSRKMGMNASAAHDGALRVVAGGRGTAVGGDCL